MSGAKPLQRGVESAAKVKPPAIPFDVDEEPAMRSWFRSTDTVDPPVGVLGRLGSDLGAWENTSQRPITVLKKLRKVGISAS